MMSRRVYICLLIICSFGFVNPTMAAIFRVPQEYASISGALAASAEDDTILVARGTYRDQLMFPSGRRTVASTFLLTGDTTAVHETILIADTTIRTDTLSAVVLRDSTVDAILTGFTIRGGWGLRRHDTPEHVTRGGGIFQGGGRLIVHRCIFTENHANLGSAHWCENGAWSRLTQCETYGNHAIQGTVVAQGANLALWNSRFHHEDAFRGAVILGRNEGTLIMDSCIVDSNRNPDAWLATVSAYQLDTAIIRYCDFVYNRNRVPFSSPGGFAAQETPSSVVGCRFIANEGSAASALTLQMAQSYVQDCIFEDNYSQMFSPGVVWLDDGSHTFNRCQFRNNRGQSWCVLGCGSGEVFAYFQDCSFEGNRAEAFDSGAAILLTFDTLCITNCEFRDNLPAVISDRLTSPGYAGVQDNYWGDASGPFHATRNPQGLGDWIIGESAIFEPWLTQPPQAADDPHPAVPERMVLLRSYPNPFNGQTRFAFRVPARGEVTLTVYNLLGERVAEPIHDMRDAGEYEIVWNAAFLPSGVYFARIASGAENAALKILLLK